MRGMRNHRVTVTEAELVQSMIEIRRDRGLSTGEVARRMHVSQPAVSQLELGHRHGRTVTLERLLRYANAIGADIQVGPR